MILIILFYYAASAKGAENEPWLVPAMQMSSAKSLGTCNLRDCIKVSGSSFRWGSIWDIPLLSWPLLGEILHEVSMKNLSCQLLMCYWTFRPFPEANLQDPLWTDLKAELVHPTLVNLGMWPCDRNEMAQEWKKKEYYVVRITKPPVHRYIRCFIHTAENETRAQANNTSVGDNVPVHDLEDDEYILHV